MLSIGRLRPGPGPTKSSLIWEHSLPGPKKFCQIWEGILPVPEKPDQILGTGQRSPPQIWKDCLGSSDILHGPKMSFQVWEDFLGRGKTSFQNWQDLLGPS